MTQYGLCGSNGRKCFKPTISNRGGAGTNRVRFLGINKLSTLENKFIPGSRIGAVNTSLRNALYKKATNHQNGGCDSKKNNSKISLHKTKNKIIFYN